MEHEHLRCSELGQLVAAVADVMLTIDRAELAFGPLYLCAGAQAGELCDAARLEWLGSVRIDLKDPEPIRAGMLSGTSGRVRSWMYDLGISSQLTQDEPFALDAAQELGGASLVVEGRASEGDSDVPFVVGVVIDQGADVERGVPVIRKGTGGSRAELKNARCISGAWRAGRIRRFPGLRRRRPLHLAPGRSHRAVRHGENGRHGDVVGLDSLDARARGSRCIGPRSCFSRALGPAAGLSASPRR